MVRALWKPVVTPLSDTNAPTRRPSLNEKTRVESDASHGDQIHQDVDVLFEQSGTPIGASGSARCSPLALRASTRGCGARSHGCSR
jgi:hypothetical protein